MTLARRIAIFCFGVARCLAWNSVSIITNVIGRARQIGGAHHLCPFYPLTDPNNPRSGEMGKITPEEYSLPAVGDTFWKGRDMDLGAVLFARLGTSGDAWQVDSVALCTLLLQLRALKVVTARALVVRLDIMIFCRPDLGDHDCLCGPLRLRHGTHGAQAPALLLQSSGGSDGSSVVTKVDRAIRPYGQRVYHVAEFCQAWTKPLHSESPAKLALRGIQVTCCRQEVSRVRINAQQKAQRDGSIIVPFQSLSLRQIAATVMKEPFFASSGCVCRTDRRRPRHA